MTSTERLDEFGVYSLYLACKLHYSNGTYNAVKYRFKTSAKQQSFWKRKDRYFFHKVGTKFNFDRSVILDYFNAHFVEDISWVGNMLDDDKVWPDYKKRLQSFGYRFEADINTLRDDHCDGGNLPFDTLFSTAAGDAHPPIIKSFLQGDIMIETIIILDNILGFIEKMNITETLVWPDLKNKLLKYGIMLDTKLNANNYKKIILKVFTS